MTKISEDPDSEAYGANTLLFQLELRMLSLMSRDGNYVCKTRDKVFA